MTRVFAKIEFPETVQYEVHAVRGGHLSNYARGGRMDKEEHARARAAEYNTEAAENFAAESQGPVKPIRTEYIVIRVTTQREVI